MALAAVALFVWPGLLKTSDEDKIRAAAAAFGAEINDPDAFCALLTPRLIDEQFGGISECQAQVEAEGEEPADVTVTSVDIQGESATAEVEADTPEGTETATIQFEKQDGEWLIDTIE